ncbi:MAG: hypothetical protein M3O50_22765 [Myxococcota bacterium]|nr:hypothetical protein [Myxococcota bacterium]
MSDDLDPERACRDRPIEAHHVRSVRIGHGANCSSVGSVIDTLFATAAVGSAVFAAVVAALAAEPVTLATERGARRTGERDDESEPP